LYHVIVVVVEDLCAGINGLQILFSMSIRIGLVASIQWSPFWIIFEQSHSLCVLVVLSVFNRHVEKSSFPYISFICGEPMVDSGRHDHQIKFIQLDSHPIIILVSHIEEPRAIQDVPNLLILVQMLIEEGFHLLLIHMVGEMVISSRFL